MARRNFDSRPGTTSPPDYSSGSLLRNREPLARARRVFGLEGKLSLRGSHRALSERGVAVSGGNDIAWSSTMFRLCWKRPR